MDYPTSPDEYSTCDDVEHPDLGYLVFDAPEDSAVDTELSKEEVVSEESLRESLKKRLEFCFSR